MRTLYLGLKAWPGTVHYPVIRTEFCGEIGEVLALWSEFTHIIFTSQSAVHYWPGPWDKLVIAIGPATASALEEKGVKPIVAKEATQEGVMELVAGMEGYFLIPRSRKARSALTDFMKERGIKFFVLDLYDTVFQKLEPVPDLAEFDEIVFTSPSTVDGFLEVYGELPKDKRLVAIGPVTEEKIRSKPQSSQRAQSPETGKK